MGIFAYFKRKSYERRLKKSDITFPLYCKAHGVKQPDRQGAIVQSKAGDRLQVVHVPLKRFPYNTYIYNVELNRVLGYVHETLAKKLVYVFGEGFCRDAVVEQITGAEEYKYHGCNLQIFESMAYMAENMEDIFHLRGK